MTSTTEPGHSALDPSSEPRDFESLRRKLLDLTARNRLLNYTHPKRGSLRVIDELPDVLAERLLGADELSFIPVPEPTRQQLIEAGYLEVDPDTGEERRLKPHPRAIDWARQLGLKAEYELPVPHEKVKDARHFDDKIQTLLYPPELEAQLRAIYNAANLSINESGANVLYLALGFLEWFESNDSDVGRIAPLFLIPATMERGRLDKSQGTYSYTIKHSGDEILANLSLREKLRVDFDLALPELESETTPEAYFKQLGKLIREQKPRWKLHRNATVGLFNFSKLLLYLDLDPTRWPPGEENILSHPVVSRFISPADHSADAVFATEYDIDRLKEVHERYPVIFDADSSQHSALVDAIDGKDLVIEGPPGTGKSQTITNLIASALANGKRVLFVAEKLAALQVVKRRLDQAGLGKFCLELHSNKAQKKAVLEELSERIESGTKRARRPDTESEIARYEHLKKELSYYAHRLNEEWKQTSRTVHFIFNRAAKCKLDLTSSAPDIEIPSVDGKSFTLQEANARADRFAQYTRAAKKIVQRNPGDQALSSHAWYGVENHSLTFLDRQRVTESLRAWQTALSELLSEFSVLAARYGLPSELGATQQTVDGWLQNASGILEHRKVAELGYVSTLGAEHLSAFDEMLEGILKVAGARKELAKKISADVLNDREAAAALSSHFRAVREKLDEAATAKPISYLIAQVDLALSKKSALDELVEILAQARNTSDPIPEGLTRPTLESASKFVEFAQFASQLPQRLAKHRDESFDSTEIDASIKDLRSACEHALELTNQSEIRIDLDNPLRTEELRAIHEALKDNSRLRRLKPKWRKARKWVRVNARSGIGKIDDLEGACRNAIAALEAIEAINRRGEWRETFGDLFEGVNTPVSDIESLRSWHHGVRARYGLGFGKEVSIGNALVASSTSTIASLRSLHDVGYLPRASEAIEATDALRGSWRRLSWFAGDTAPSIEPDAAGWTELVDISEALHHLAERVGADSDSKNVAMVVEKIDLLYERVDSIAEAYDRLCVPSDLRLQYPYDRSDSERLAELRRVRALLDAFSQEPFGARLKSTFDAAPSQEFFTELDDFANLIETAAKEAKGREDEFVDLTALNAGAWNTDQSLSGLIERASVALDSKELFDEWADFTHQKEYFRSRGYQELLDRVESELIPLNKAEEAFDYVNYTTLAREVFREVEGFANLTGEQLLTLQEKFKACDLELIKLQRKRIAATITRREVPVGVAGGKVSEYTELSLVKHEIGKKTKHQPIRQLLRRAGTAVLGLKPCFMMSPMSVAQYLTPGQVDFDLIVMDEASQIRPEDALGAIARGSQLVVVGDPKQLPPTSFFDRVIDDGDEDQIAIKDSGSILDAALPIFRARRLRWHYRSRHESLIRFSNQQFYNNDLVVFPSPHASSDEYGVKFHFVRKGRFVSRRNLEEAQVVAEALANHVRTWPGESVGVVAMNSEQREQIDRCFEELVKDNSILQGAVAKNLQSNEPIFIKNLENVQGDERDVMYLSMTYGPPRDGSPPYQHFGPINRDNGWRRLNVLFTRAKKRMHVFSSMRSGDVVPTQTSSRGVLALRDFLNFAERGFIETSRPSGRDPDSDFEVSVATALKGYGFDVVPQVGVAGFYIDLAVKHPSTSGHYLLGIECDGATYHSGKSARDRDRLRQTILEQLGWKIRRIWSTDWFRDPEACLVSIVNELRDLAGDMPQPEAQASEVDLIDAIEGEESKDVQEASEFASEGMTLREQLEAFDEQVIRAKFPDTPPGRRLLRPAMVEALCEFHPVTRSEFAEQVPYYLRHHTDSQEGKYLGIVLDIIVEDETSMN